MTKIFAKWYESEGRAIFQCEEYSLDEVRPYIKISRDDIEMII